MYLQQLLQDELMNLRQRVSSKNLRKNLKQLQLKKKLFRHVYVAGWVSFSFKDSIARAK